MFVEKRNCLWRKETVCGEKNCSLKKKLFGEKKLFVEERNCLWRKETVCGEKKNCLWRKKTVWKKKSAFFGKNSDFEIYLDVVDL